MNRNMNRRKARAIAISTAAEAQGRAVVTRALGALALAFGAVEAVWALHHVLVAR